MKRCTRCWRAPPRGANPKFRTIQVMRVSVVIPCFNSLDWLPQTVDSVLAQTFTDFEVVLVDDGGSDELDKWAAELGDQRVRVVRQDNAGVSAARNLGIREAKAPLIAFLDSDDLWVPKTLEWFVEAFDASPEVGVVYGHYDVIDDNNQPTGRVEAHSFSGEVWADFVETNAVGMSAAMVPAAVFADVGVFQVNRDKFPIDVEDWELWIRIADTYPAAVVAEIVCHHRRHDSNSSTNTESLELAYRNMLEEVFSDQPPHRMKMQPVATARAEVVLAWHSLNDDRDADAALGFRLSAVRHLPPLRRTPEYWRLGIAAYALKFGGEGVYSFVRGGFGAARLARSGA